MELREEKDLRIQGGNSIGEVRHYEISGLRTLASKWRRTKEEAISRIGRATKPKGNKTTKVSRFRVCRTS